MLIDAEEHVRDAIKKLLRQYTVNIGLRVQKKRELRQSYSMYSVGSSIFASLKAFFLFTQDSQFPQCFSLPR